MFRFLPFNNGYGASGGAINSQSMMGFASWSSTATADIAPYRMELVSRARQLSIISPMASAAVKRIVGGIIGEGLKYAYAQTSELMEGDYVPLAQYIYKQFQMASHLHSLDAQGRLTWSQFQEIACYNWLLSGEVFFVRKHKSALSSWRIIEADRCITPYYMATKEPLSLVCYNPENGNRIIDGVELDEDARPVAYWFLKDYVQKPLEVTDDQIMRIPAYDDNGLPLVIHLFKPTRPDQFRGVPCISEVIETIFSTQNFIQATEQAAQFEAALYGFIKSENPTMDETDVLPVRDLDEKIPLEQKTEDTPKDAPVMTLDPNYNQDIQAQSWLDKYYPRPKTVSAGSIIHLGENEDIKFLQSTHPNSNFDAYIKSQQGQVASALGIPKQALTCEFDTTYASAKAAVIQANETYKQLRSYFLESFVKPVFEVFVYDSLQGLVDDPLFAAVSMTIESIWEAPAMMCLDELKELQAWKMAIELGLVTRDQAAQAMYSHKATGTPAPPPEKTEEIDEV